MASKIREGFGQNSVVVHGMASRDGPSPKRTCGPFSRIIFRDLGAPNARRRQLAVAREGAWRQVVSPWRHGESRIQVVGMSFGTPASNPAAERGLVPIETENGERPGISPSVPYPGAGGTCGVVRVLGCSLIAPASALQTLPTSGRHRTERTLARESGGGEMGEGSKGRQG
ncbi:hypothetical protein GWK47_052576 [Chionoecetes opilio]|uniref:Uncharacterized protein n=1 Tax=Chionoecetes opilio TaxID=41210 RepID=A0A8J4Y026_CHIOP|nr:hypothetical protein GWK47_052576 [Chionoecetes opilio]